MTFAETIERMTSAAAAGDGGTVVECFTPNGVYHDVFYGAFVGPDIKDLIENYFHRDGENFRWDVHDPVASGDVGYARYVFSYDSKLEAMRGRRAIFEGVAVCRLRDGLIASYGEIANAAVGLTCLEFPPERISKFLVKQADELKQRQEAQGHFPLR